jgi:hypothetical protein
MMLPSAVCERIDRIAAELPYWVFWTVWFDSGLPRFLTGRHKYDIKVRAAPLGLWAHLGRLPRVAQMFASSHLLHPGLT